MRLARVLSYIGLTHAMFIWAVWYGYYFYWNFIKQWEKGISTTEILSKINGFQMTMLIYPILILVLFVRILSVGTDGKLTKAWSLIAFLAMLMGLFFLASMWFIIGVGAGLTGLVVGLLPCLIVSIILIWLLCANSPLNSPSRNSQKPPRESGDGQLLE